MNDQARQEADELFADAFDRAYRLIGKKIASGTAGPSDRLGCALVEPRLDSRLRLRVECVLDGNGIPTFVGRSVVPNPPAENRMNEQPGVLSDR